MDDGRCPSLSNCALSGLKYFVRIISDGRCPSLSIKALSGHEYFVCIISDGRCPSLNNKAFQGLQSSKSLEYFALKGQNEIGSGNARSLYQN